MKNLKKSLLFASPLITILGVYALLYGPSVSIIKESEEVVNVSDVPINTRKLITPLNSTQTYEGGLRYMVLTKTNEIITKDSEGNVIRSLKLNEMCDDGTSKLSREIISINDKQVVYYTFCADSINLWKNNERIKKINLSELGFTDNINANIDNSQVGFSENLMFLFFSIQSEDKQIEATQSYKNGLINIINDEVINIAPDRSDFKLSGLGLVGFFDNENILVFYQKHPSGAVASDVFEYKIESREYSRFLEGHTPFDIIAGKKVDGNKLIFHNSSKAFSDEIYENKVFLEEINFREGSNTNEYELQTDFVFQPADMASGIKYVTEDGKKLILQTTDLHWIDTGNVLNQDAYKNSKIVITNEYKIIKEYFVDPRKQFRFHFLDNTTIVYSEIGSEEIPNEDGVGWYYEYSPDSLYILNMENDHVVKITDFEKEVEDLLYVYNL